MPFFEDKTMLEAYSWSDSFFYWFNPIQIPLQPVSIPYKVKKWNNTLNNTCAHFKQMLPCDFLKGPIAPKDLCLRRRLRCSLGRRRCRDVGRPQPGRRQQTLGTWKPWLWVFNGFFPPSLKSFYAVFSSCFFLLLMGLHDFMGFGWVNMAVCNWMTWFL